MTDYYVAFWNLENLFDVGNSPRRSDKLQRTIGNELNGWTTTVMNRKIRQLASIIMQMQQGDGPDLLGVCEVENDYVLERLIDALDPLNRNYAIAHHDMSDRRGIDVAFIYDRDLFNAEDQFSYFIVKRSATRDLFQVNFRTTNADKLLIVIGNHWPSRSGGQLDSEPYRIIAGETLAYFHERIRSIHGQNVAVIAMGDFNDEPYDRSLSEYALAERIRSKVSRARNPKFYNLMWDFLGERIGSHYYNNIPNVLDQFLVSKGIVTASSGIRLLDNTTEIVRFSEMIGPGGAPIRFGRGNSINRDGYSDHFPIAVKVREM
jgi:hypothetical protein